MSVGVPQRWKASRVEQSVSSSRRDEGSGLGNRERRVVRQHGGSGPEATGVSEVRLDRKRPEEATPRANPRKPAEANEAS